MIARHSKYRVWIWPAVAAAVTLLALELTDRFYPPLAYVGGAVVLVVVVVWLVIIAVRQP